MKRETFLTNKKLLLSLGVLAGAVFLSFLGVYIHGKIVNDAEQKARIYQTALKTKSDEELNYAIDTHQGYILGQVTIRPVDLVKFPEMNKEFAYVSKTEETYTQHEREVCETKYRTKTRTIRVSDGDGYTTETEEVEVPYEECHQETYYSWDRTGHWELEAKKVSMAQREYAKSMFALDTSSIDAKDIIQSETGHYVNIKKDHLFDVDFLEEADEGDKRIYYNVVDLPKSGIVFLSASETLSAGFGDKIVIDTRNAETIVKQAQNSAQTQSTVFNVIWFIIILSELIGLGYLVWFYEKS